MNRQEALAAGAKRYEGRPCRHDGTVIRQASNGSCIECNRRRRGEYREANREKVNAGTASWRERNREKSRAASARWAANNPERVKRNMAAYREANKEHIKQKQKSWREANADHIRDVDRARRKARPHIHRAKKQRRRAAQKNATPTWGCPAAIHAIYERAGTLGASLGRDLHVDHIVPLTHPLVSGLHCWHNLQLLDAELNQRKNNRHWPDMPSDVNECLSFYGLN